MADSKGIVHFKCPALRPLPHDCVLIRRVKAHSLVGLAKRRKSPCKDATNFEDFNIMKRSRLAAVTAASSSSKSPGLVLGSQPPPKSSSSSGNPFIIIIIYYNIIIYIIIISILVLGGVDPEESGQRSILRRPRRPLEAGRVSHVEARSLQATVEEAERCREAQELCSDERPKADGSIFQ